MAGASWEFEAGASWESEAGASWESEAGASWEFEAGESGGSASASFPFFRRGGRTGLTARARGRLPGWVVVSPDGVPCSASSGLGIQSCVFRVCIAANG